jgi:hypothetical protein
MARAFLLSHGARVPGSGNTFVPEGKSISFYSEYDENTLRSIGLAAVNAGDVTPVDTFTGPAEIPNYLLAKFEDNAIAQHLAAESSQTGGRMYFVGSDLPSPTRLCTSPSTCATTHPHHAQSCNGIFNKIAEEEIFSVSCRGVLGETGESTRTMEGDTEFVDENKKEGERILTWAQAEPEAAMEYWQSLTDITRVMIGSNYVPVRTFAENYFKGGGESTPAAVLEARRYLEAQGEDSFFDWSQQWDTKRRGIIETDSDLRSLLERLTRARLGLSGGSGGTGGTGGSGGSGGSGDEMAKQVETVKSQATNLTQAASGLSEDGGGDLSGLTTAFSTFMQDVQALQKMAATAGATEVERAAVSLQEAGAEAGRKTAVFQESPGEESLAGVKSAFADVGQRADSLSAG